MVGGSAGQGRLGRHGRVLAPDFVDHDNLPRLPPGPEGMKQVLTYYTASPELPGHPRGQLRRGRQGGAALECSRHPPGRVVRPPRPGTTLRGAGCPYRLAEGKAVEGWNSIEVNPTEEEQRWLTEGGRWPGGAARSQPPRAIHLPRSGGNVTRNLTGAPGSGRPRSGTHRARAQVARQIQRELLPEATPELDGWELTTYYEPAREVGGDFYDFLELEDGRLGW